MDKMYHRFADRVDFYNIYIREAHPTDGWVAAINERAGIRVAQPTSDSERKEVAGLCSTALDLSIPMLVDTIDDRVDTAYSAFPDRLYLIDREGRIAYKSGRGPFGYQPRELEQSLIMLLMDD